MHHVPSMHTRLILSCNRVRAYPATQDKHLTICPPRTMVHFPSTQPSHPATPSAHTHTLNFSCPQKLYQSSQKASHGLQRNSSSMHKALLKWIRGCGHHCRSPISAAVSRPQERATRLAANSTTNKFLIVSNFSRELASRQRVDEWNELRPGRTSVEDGAEYGA